MSKNIKVYTTNICPYCVQAKRLLSKLGLAYEEISLEGKHEERVQLSQENSGWRTVPMIFIDDQFVGGYTELEKLYREGKLS